jgi:hypothetical protein
MTYVLIVVQTREQADELNAKLPLPSADMKMQAIFYGESICGLHYRGQRPNVIFANYTDDGGRWKHEVLMSSFARGAVLIGM